MQRFHRILSNTTFGLNVLLLFLLIFKERLEIPLWLQFTGRMHPLFIHLPIGFLIFCAVIILFRRNFKKNSFRRILRFTFQLTAVTVVMAALMGMILSKEGGYDDATLSWHLASAVGLSVLSALLLIFVSDKKINPSLFKYALLLSLSLLVMTAHFGATLTHGENYIFQPLLKSNVALVTDSSSMYEAAIQPLFNSRCIGCHNQSKRKGGLVMISPNEIARGGESGPIWIACDPAQSEIVRRLRLPLDHDDHMPPAGKSQLSKGNIRMIELWIQGGADLMQPWKSFSDSLLYFAENEIAKGKEVSRPARKYDFDFPSSEEVQKANNEYRHVSFIAQNEPALEASFFLPENYKPESLRELLEFKDQIVWLNLTGMPIGEEDIRIITKLTNLERLNLNNTPINSKVFAVLSDLKNLKSFSLAGTQVDRTAFSSLHSMPSISSIYLWNSNINQGDLSSLQKEFNTISWNLGYQPIDAEVLKLTPPILVNENPVLSAGDKIVLKHNFPGTEIRYTLDGSEPDSIKSPVYKSPLTSKGLTILKAVACKANWLASEQVKFYLFEKGIVPDRVQLLQNPDKEFKGTGASTLLDNKKGDPDNYRDGTWLGYRGSSFTGLFQFDSESFNSITISFNKNIPSFIMPPAKIEIWAGETEKNMVMVKRFIPLQPKGYEKSRVEGISLQVSAPANKMYKIIIEPLAKLPTWHSGKGEKAWVMIDEIFFN